MMEDATVDMQVEITSNENETVNEDEQEGEKSAPDEQEASAELADPAILAVGEMPKYKYTKEQLLKLREAPLSQKAPEFLNTEEVSPTIWDPERWNDRKKSVTPTENGPRVGDLADNRRRLDPRERIRKENDGIVLSPQRKSFNSGCFVAARPEAPTRGNRPHSPLGAKNDNSHMVREIQPGQRRIGSGRILRDWDYSDKGDGENGYSGYRNQSRNTDREERRSFGRDFDSVRDKDKDKRNGSRFGERRRISSEKDEEPEWYSSEITQHDTIELRGFDDAEKLSKRKMSASQAKRVREWAKKKGESTSVDKDEGGISKTSPTSQAVAGQERTGAGKEDAKAAAEPADGASSSDKENNAGVENSNVSGGGLLDINSQAFNFDEILKCESITGLLSNDIGGDGDNTSSKSRFSRWFKLDSPEKPSMFGDVQHQANSNNNTSRRSSVQEEHHLLKNLLNEIAGEPSTLSIQPPGDVESYFAPISPAAANISTGTSLLGHQRASPSNAMSSNAVAAAKALNLVEMLQRGKHQQQGVPHHANYMQDVPKPRKIMSLDELEARMKGVEIAAMTNQQKQQQKQEDEMAAFKRLLAQVTGGHAVTANGPQKMPPMSLMEMLSHSQQQEEAQARLNHLTGRSHVTGARGGIAPTSPNAVSTSDTLKFQQMQNQMQQKLMSTNMHMRAASMIQEMTPQQGRELLTRPEAQAILQGLKRGDITPQHLYQQLANPALQPRHREMLNTILKLWAHQATAGGGAAGAAAGQGGAGGGMGPSPRVLSPIPPPPSHAAMFQQQQQQVQQQQQLRVSPLPPNAIHQRIPSPRELQVHTQNILQRALIKKKLEEQQENFRKKQEMQQQRGQSPNINNNNHNTNNNNNANATSTGGQGKSVSSPTPLAFTPTSVLRKMTADKDDAGKDINKLVSEVHKIQPQGRAVTAMRQPPQSQPQGNNWNVQFGAAPGLKQPVGRPIVKANSYQQLGPEQFFGNQQQQPQQVQRLFAQQVQQALQRSGKYPPGQSSTVPVSQSGGSSSQYPTQSNQQPQQFPQLTQQQLRAQHQAQLNVPPQQSTGANSSSSSNNSQQHQTNSNVHQQQMHQNYHRQHQSDTAWQQFLNAAAAQQTSNRLGGAGQQHHGRGGLNGGDLSPSTSNQLARWFSPDLLERARGGELPSTQGLAQHAVSLEEVERQTAPPVHN